MHHFLWIHKTILLTVSIQHGFLILENLEQSMISMENYQSDLKWDRLLLQRQLKRYNKMQISSCRKWQNGHKKNEVIIQKHMRYSKRCIYMGKILLLLE
jgi:hypothetical protein